MVANIIFSNITVINVIAALAKTKLWLGFMIALNIIHNMIKKMYIKSINKQKDMVNHYRKEKNLMIKLALNLSVIFIYIF